MYFELIPVYQSGLTFKIAPFVLLYGDYSCPFIQQRSANCTGSGPDIVYKLATSDTRLVNQLL